jgi:hypothetical protein
VGFLSQFKGAPGVIERLLRHLVRCQMVFHTVVCSGNPVRVSGLFVHFGGYSMRIQWQTHLLADQLTPQAQRALSRAANEWSNFPRGRRGRGPFCACSLVPIH